MLKIANGKQSIRLMKDDLFQYKAYCASRGLTMQRDLENYMENNVNNNFSMIKNNDIAYVKPSADQDSTRLQFIRSDKYGKYLEACGKENIDPIASLAEHIIKVALL